MTKQTLTREQEVYKRLASTGKYVNTGKVLIGLSYVPQPPQMTQSEEFIQGVLLGSYRPLFSSRAMAYFTVAIVTLASLFVSCSR
jgi:hypothetical protein